MDLKNFAFSVKEQLEEGEELLHKVYNFKNKPGRKEVVIAGIDGGSTQTRVLLITKEGFDSEKVYTIPSNHGILADDRTVIPKSGKLYDRLDSYLIDERDMQSTMFTKHRVLRGTKLKDTNLGEKRIDSTTQKISNVSFYDNIIDAIGYSLAMEYDSEIPEEVEFYAGIALPPDDISSEKNTHAFKKNLIGDFKWSHKESGVVIKIKIKAVEVSTEPEACVKAFYASQDCDVPELCLHVNGGGRSIGVELLENGDAIASASRTLAYGGTQLLDKLGNNYIQEHGGRIPTYAALSRAIKTGMMKDGASLIDVADLVKTTKDQFAEDIMSDIMAQVFDQQTRITLTDIEEITVSGRLFAKGDYDYSIAEKLKQLFAKESPNTNFVMLSDNLIPLGLVMAVYSKFGGLLDEEEEEEASENEITLNLDDASQNVAATAQE